MAALQDEAGELPTAPRLLADDATPESLAVLTSKHNQRIAMLEAEGGFFDTLSGRYTGGVPNLDAVLKAWSGEAVRIDRRHAEPVILNEPTLTMILNATGSVVRTGPDLFLSWSRSGWPSAFSSTEKSGRRSGRGDPAHPQ